jgi:hypothetical protein
MPRSTAALLLPLLAPLTGCDEQTAPSGSSQPTEQAEARWFPAARFRNDIRLPEASQARPWHPPAEGPVPVVEILRDGRCLVDGEPIEGELDERDGMLRARLGEAAKRMPRERLAPDYDAGPWIPSNPVLLRVDHDAPWDALRKVIEVYGLPGVQIWQTELQVASPDGSSLRCLSVPRPRDIGFHGMLGRSRWIQLVLDAGARLDAIGLQGAELPVPITLLLPVPVDEPTDVLVVEQERFSDAADLLARLEEIRSTTRLFLELHVAPHAPAWVGVAALDLGTAAGVDVWDIPPRADSPTWNLGSQLAPFRDDIELARARGAMPRQAPLGDGPFPLVEVLRDGSYLVDGVPVEDAVESEEELDAGTSLKWWLSQQAEAMPEKPVNPDRPRSPLIPANSVLLRVDREAPWKAVRTALWNCGLTGIELRDIDLAVEGPTPELVPVVRLPLDRTIGLSNYGSGEPAYRIVWLEAGAPPLAAPVRLGFLGLRTDDDRERVELSERVRDEVPDFAEALGELSGWAEPPVTILFPEETPWWAALEVLELALEAGLDAPLGFDIPGDPLEEHLADLRAWIAEQQEDSDR